MKLQYLLFSCIASSMIVSSFASLRCGGGKSMCGGCYGDGSTTGQVQDPPCCSCELFNCLAPCCACCGGRRGSGGSTDTTPASATVPPTPSSGPEATTKAAAATTTAAPTSTVPTHTYNGPRCFTQNLECYKNLTSSNATAAQLYNTQCIGPNSNCSDSLVKCDMINNPNNICGDKVTNCLNSCYDILANAGFKDSVSSPCDNLYYNTCGDMCDNNFFACNKTCTTAECTKNCNLDSLFCWDG